MNWFALSVILVVNLIVMLAGLYATVVVFGWLGTIPLYGAGAASCLLLPYTYRRGG